MASSPLISCINSLLAAIGEIAYSWPDDFDIADRGKLFQHVAVWNNHVKREKAGGFTFGKPACFVEILPIKWQQLNLGANTCDLKLRFHIIDRQLDAMDGTMDQNLQVLAYRDLFMNAISGFYPDFCNALSSTDEKQDTEHDDVYHLLVDMVCAFVDTKGAAIDPDSGQLAIIPENSNVVPEVTAVVTNDI